MLQVFTSTAKGFFFGLDHRGHSIALLFLFAEWEIKIVFEAIICYLLFVSSCVIVQMNEICILSSNIRIPLNMSLKNIFPLHFLSNWDAKVVLYLCEAIDLEVDLWWLNFSINVDVSYHACVSYRLELKFCFILYRQGGRAWLTIQHCEAFYQD